MSSGSVGRVRGLIAAGVTDPPTPRRRRLRLGRVDLVFAADLLIALICWLTTTNSLGSVQAAHQAYYSPVVLTLVALAVSAPLALRNFTPLTALTASAL